MRLQVGVSLGRQLEWHSQEWPEEWLDADASAAIALVDRLDALPPYDFDRDGLAGNTAWLTVHTPGESSLLLYFWGNGIVYFEWYPELQDGLVGNLKIATICEILGQLDRGESSKSVDTAIRARAENLGNAREE
jgi:hypothetical protein